MTALLTPATDTAIGQLLHKFTQGDASMLGHVADDIDFRIDHFRDEADTSWQVAGSLDGLIQVLGRLGQEVFPKGTTALGLDTFALGEGWHLTRFHQRFYYGVRQCDVTSVTQIISHEAHGKVDYFRETVTDIVSV
ncbi:hypothetical protein [Pseudosulfitobacter sp. DSM 107133]|uniref:hypothetical protein n=1 Tax=Pseudosulfitobacter sp. DSM 107133 TaxID=2883100 RepID=UPI000DF1A395|nr:hypothetical protein [Pseudosulfitobacter sp. DSM 107133]UOA26276.1 hypothetical protein DSM107133_00973 [Pseudosulfitobacter sp. DSM 107133]